MEWNLKTRDSVTFIGTWTRDPDDDMIYILGTQVAIRSQRDSKIFYLKDQGFNITVQQYNGQRF